MARKPKTKPDGFVCYRHTLETLPVCPTMTVGAVFQAAAAYFKDGTTPDFSDDPAAVMLWTALKCDIDGSFDRFDARRQRNIDIANNRYGNHGAPMVTNGDQSQPMVTNGHQSAPYNNRKETIREEKNIKETNLTEEGGERNERKKHRPSIYDDL